MADVNVSSDESEGLFNEFIHDRLEDVIEQVLNDGDLDRLGDHGSDVIVEIDDITPPEFVYSDEQSGAGAGESGGQPGTDSGKLRFLIPFNRIMELMGEKLRLPHLDKKGSGAIKEVSHEFRSYGPVGVILDKRRTFKRALKSSIGMGVYDPGRGKHAVEVRRRDRRYRVPQRVEKPLFRAAVFYMGDISYSTHGARLELEKRLVNFIHQWLDFNYGDGNVEHRFFVHDMEAYEVSPEDFYNVSNAGGTRASIVFDLVSQIAFNEYSSSTTNFYAFYFGDGEVFGPDAGDIVELIDSEMHDLFSRIGIVEVQPSSHSALGAAITEHFGDDEVVRCGRLSGKRETVAVIKALFR